jgi:hypothetical protein
MLCGRRAAGRGNSACTAGMWTENQKGQNSGDDDDEDDDEEHGAEAISFLV